MLIVIIILLKLTHLYLLKFNFWIYSYVIGSSEYRYNNNNNKIIIKISKTLNILNNIRSDRYKYVFASKYFFFLDQEVRGACGIKKKYKYLQIWCGFNSVNHDYYCYNIYIIQKKNTFILDLQILFISIEDFNLFLVSEIN